MFVPHLRLKKNKKTHELKKCLAYEKEIKHMLSTSYWNFLKNDYFIKKKEISIIASIIYFPLFFIISNIKL